MTDPTQTEPVPTEPGPTERSAARGRPAARQAHAASGARILVGGLAVGAGLAMVGAMAAAAQASEADTSTVTLDAIRRVVVVDQPPKEIVVVRSGDQEPEVITQVVRREILVPAPQRQAPAPQTQSGGS